MALRSRWAQWTLVLAILPTAAAGEVPHQTIDRVNGLPSSQVHAITQDAEGFLWFAGPAGLVRYEGRRMVRWGRQEGLSTQGLRALAIDSRNRLWIGSDLGVEIFENLPSGPLVPLPGLENRARGFVERILVEPGSDGDRVWFGTSEGLYRLSPDAGLQQLCVAEIGRSMVSDLALAEEGELWAVAPTRGLFHLRGDSCSRFDPEIGVMSSVSMTGPHNLILGSDSGLYAYDSEAHHVVRVLGSGSPVTALLHRGERLWVGIGNRLLELRSGGDGWFEHAELATGVKTNQLYLDRQEVLWVATDGGGILKFTPFGQAIQRLETPCETQIYSLGRLANGNIFVGGDLCSWWMDPSTGAIELWVSSLDENKIWDVLDPGGDRAWAATELGLYSSSDRRVWKRDSRALPELENPGRCLLDMGQEEIWVGNVTGLYSLSPDGARELVADGFGLGYVYTLETDPRSGDVWIGTIGNGLWKASGPDRIERVEGIGLYDTGNVYTISIGVDRVVLAQDDRLLEIRDGIVTELPQVSREPVAAWTSLFDSSGVLWVGGAVGLERYDAEGQMRLTSKVGLAGDEFTSSRSLFDLGESLLAGTSVGLSKIDRAGVAAVEISRPRARAVEVVWHNVDPEKDASGRFLVRPGRWTLDVVALAPWFLDETALRYQYRMLGFDSQWSEPLAPRDSRIRFTGLPSGDYLLESRVSTELGPTGPVTELLRITVLPDWWQRPWFWTLTVLSLASVVWLVWSYRSRQLRQRAAFLEEAVVERTRKLEELSKKLHRQAFRDDLTGLANRWQMESDYGRFVSRAQRSGRPFSMVVIDLNRFKTVNDEHGHAVGDRLLRHVSEHLKSSCRPTDLVSRWGGDEFVLLLDDTEGVQADQILTRIQAELRQKPLILEEGTVIFTSIAFGIVTWSKPSDDLESLFRRADRSVYVMKKELPQRQR